MFFLLLFSVFQPVNGQPIPSASAPATGVAYTNEQVPAVPWSIHVVKVERNNRNFSIASAHAGNRAVGLSTLAEQVAGLERAAGTPVAAINGGYYQRDQAYAGGPRGLQIVERELLSAPDGNPTFWVDVLGEPHLSLTDSRFQITWPNGTTSSVGLNGPRRDDGIVVYTPAAGSNTHTSRGREFTLERMDGSPWLPLRLNRTYAGRVCAVSDTGDSPIPTNGIVVSVGPAALGAVEGIAAGARLRISTSCTQPLTGVRNALSAGPILLLDGKRQKIRSSPDAPYEESSMLERHPRTAVGWNDKCFFLVVVDGRQRDLSLGMTLDELSQYLQKLGCHTALNLDGGGSSTLWWDGEVRNEPCDGYARPIANCLVVLSREGVVPQRARTPGHPTAKPGRAESYDLSVLAP